MMKTIGNFLLIPILILLNACSGSNDDIRAQVEKIKTMAPGKIEQLPAAQEYVSEDYTVRDVRSPFDLRGKSSVELTDTAAGDNVNQAPRPDADRKREPLESFAIRDLIFVGSMSKKNFVWGLIKDKTGLVHAVKVGDYLGQNSGKVVSIFDDRINFVETVVNGSGGWEENLNSLSLKTGKEGK